jgi:hypothetical protein
MLRMVSLALVSALASGAFFPAKAMDDAADFMARFSGEWLGTGQLLVGSESGLTFNCSLNGDPSRTLLTFGMTGRCWMAGLSANVHAHLRYNAETNRFYGQFMDGAEGDGLDIVGEREHDGFSMQLVRGPVQGRLLAESLNPHQMRVTIFYRDRARNRELPVVSMGFTRKEARALGLPEFGRGLVTGSVNQ